MKTVNYFGACCVGLLMGMLPLISSAKESDEGSVLTHNFSFETPVIDSLPKARRQDDKEKSSKKKPKEDVKEEPKEGEIKRPEVKRPDIKEVPKAIPRLRPGVVGERIKIKRPPVRVKPGRLGGHIGL